jgi:hypothetical protein
MAGVIVGLDLSEALVTARALGARNDPVITEYLTALEDGALTGVAKLAPK